MNLKNLILTPTVDMNRAQWLEWRQPVNHVKLFLKTLFAIKNNVQPEGLSLEQMFQQGKNYDIIKDLFTSQEWKDFQFPCVGGSEVSSLLGLNPYKSVIELYYEKVGLKDTFQEDNIAMFMGRTLEATIADLWQYWSGSAESVVENSNAGKIIRKCRRMNAYIQNKNFPWLYCSLDRVINKVGEKEEGVLECKTISGYSANQWENGIPPMYVCQLQDQLLITELDFGEMAILKDGRSFEDYPFDAHPGIAERLKNESLTFFQMVKAGIENYLLWKASGNEEYLRKIDQYSPEPDGSTAYESFLNKQFKEGGYEVFGGVIEVHLAKAYKFYDEFIKEQEAKQRECSNKLKAFMKDAAVIDLGNDGKVTWKADKRGTRSFRIFTTVEADFRPNTEIIKTEPLIAVEDGFSREKETIGETFFNDVAD